MCIFLFPSACYRGRYSTIATALAIMTLLICAPQRSDAAATPTVAIFHQLPAQLRKLVPMMSLYDVKTEITCAMHCFTHIGCTSMVYHEDTLECIIGSEVVFDIGATSGLLYTALLDVPVLKLPYKLQYLEALSVCRIYGGKLFRMDSVDKWLLLANKVTDVTWVGLSDKQTEGALQWADDDSPIDPYFKNVVFKPGQPSDPAGTKDCAIMNSPWNPDFPYINTDSCNLYLSVICELPYESIYFEA